MREHINELAAWLLLVPEKDWGFAAHVVNEFMGCLKTARLA